ncbi:MAG: MAPEG family protein [Pseudomonadota bacterium]
MPVELVQVLLAVALVPAHFVPYAIVANLHLGMDYTTGPRDEPVDLPPLCGRLKRAYENYLESLPWFAIVMIVAHLSERADGLITTLGWVYLGLRVAYVPAYVSGVPLLRSVIWMFATGAIFIALVWLLIGV